MGERYVAGVVGEGDWGVWDNAEESWTTRPLPTLTEEGMTELARLLNENVCAVCGEQCGEAHANVRIGRVCEDCADHALDESGELIEEHAYLATLNLVVGGRDEAQARGRVENLTLLAPSGDSWEFGIVAVEADPKPRPISLQTALTLAITSLDELAEGAADEAAVALFGGASGTLSRFLESLGYGR